MFKVIKTEGCAARRIFLCPRRRGPDPGFMNVGTQGAIKGAVSAHDLKEIGCQIELSNTYHLHLRPGDDVVRQMGGLHKFMDWDGPILTDSGGFQVFSLAGAQKNYRRRRYICLSYRWQAHFYGGRRNRRGSSPIWVLILPWPLMSAWKIGHL